MIKVNPLLTGVSRRSLFTSAATGVGLALLRPLIGVLPAQASPPALPGLDPNKYGDAAQTASEALSQCIMHSIRPPPLLCLAVYKMLRTCIVGSSCVSYEHGVHHIVTNTAHS